jgi:3-hydroxymyristoyl/3-hydroxydecanoyl-(acyl carrier protein) dehydratase
VPGVLIAEALAQFSGLVGASAMAGAPAAPPRGKLAHVDVRFTEAVVPPAQIILRSRLTRTLGALQQFEVTALCKGAAVASGSLTIAYEMVAEAKA